jgi:hypothetical protein
MTELQRITFAEFVEYGRRWPGANIVNGIPWHFEYNGHPVTHENDECYLIGMVRFTPADVLIIREDGTVDVCRVALTELQRRVLAYLYAVKHTASLGRIHGGINIDTYDREGQANCRTAIEGLVERGLIDALRHQNFALTPTGRRALFDKLGVEA